MGVVVVAALVAVAAMVALDAQAEVWDFLFGREVVFFMEGKASWAIRRMPHAAVDMDAGDERNDGRRSTNTAVLGRCIIVVHTSPPLKFELSPVRYG